MSTNDKHSDNDLKAYLDGRDGVAAAYRKTAREEPPAALDRAILDAARAEFAEDRFVKSSRPVASMAIPRLYAPYALAASVMLAILATSLYVDQRPVPPPEVLADQRVVMESGDEPRRGESVARERQVASEQQRQATEQRQAAASRAEFATRQLASAEPVVGIAVSLDAPTLEQNVAAEALARIAESPLVVIDGPLLEQIEADAAQAQAGQQARTGGDLEEITVTGSRIVRRDERDLSYRASRETWLEQIRALTEELQTRSRLVTASRNNAALAAQLEAEMELFLAEYPDSDLDAELGE